MTLIPAPESHCRFWRPPMAARSVMNREGFADSTPPSREKARPTKTPPGTTRWSPCTRSPRPPSAAVMASQT
eukprot:4998218-Lingulodinium_polyedra.AAC.1